MLMASIPTVWVGLYLILIFATRLGSKLRLSLDIRRRPRQYSTENAERKKNVSYRMGLNTSSHGAPACARQRRTG